MRPDQPELQQEADRPHHLLAQRPVQPRGERADGAVPGGEAGQHNTDLAGLPSAELAQLIQELTDQMKGAAAELHFELAARLRDEISDLKKELRQMMEAGAK